MRIEAVGGAIIVEGDALEVLRALPDRSIHCCMTSPPYWGLRDYKIQPTIWGGDPACEHKFVDEIIATEVGKGNWAQGTNGRGELQKGGVDAKREPIRSMAVRGFCHCGAWRGTFGLEPTPALYVEHAVMIFREVRRVLRDDGTLFLNLGDSYATGAGKAASPSGGAQGERFLESGPSGYRSAHDLSPKHAMAQVPDGKNPNAMIPTYQPNRMPQAGLKPKDLVGIPWMVAFALRADGWYLRQDLIWAKPNPMPESVRDRCTKAHEYIFLLSKSERYYFDADSIAEPSTQDERRETFRGGAYCKGSTFDNSHGGRANVVGNVRLQGPTRNKRSVWTVATQPFKGAHFATFPPKLIEPCILAGCPAGGVVLDPFAGAGTTGLVANRLQRRSVLIELNPQYVDIACARLKAT